MSPVEVVQAQLDAYNAQDIDAFIALFDDDCVIGELNGAITQCGKAQVRERYAKLFADYPENHARLVNRIAAGAVVVDHEDIVRAPGGERFQAGAIYSVRDARIVRVDFFR